MCVKCAENRTRIDSSSCCVCQKNCIGAIFRRDFVCRPRPRPQIRRTCICQVASASSARPNYDQIILVETSEKGWRVTQGWHPEEGVRGAAENYERFDSSKCAACYDPPSDLCYLFSFLFSDINELNLPKTCGTEFPDPDDLLSFKLIICPDEVSTARIQAISGNR